VHKHWLFYAISSRWSVNEADLDTGPGGISSMVCTVLLWSLARASHGPPRQDPGSRICI